jgi:ABC-2 type transport system ATP-binding protein
MKESRVVLRTEKLSKRFAAPVLSEVSFEIREGESVALVGANGAGKSTLIKILLGLVYPDSGEGELFGHRFDSPEARARVGYLPEIPGYWGEVSAVEFLGLMAKLRGLPPKKLEARAPKLLEALGLRLRGTRPMAGFSKGMLQRAGIAQTLLHDPDLLILDEPMSGLDPRAQEKLRQILLQLREQGKTLLISSHALEDIRLLTDRTIVLERSKLVLDAPTDRALEELAVRYRSSEPWDEDPLGEWNLDRRHKDRE